MAIHVVRDPNAGHEIQKLVVGHRPVDQAPLNDCGAVKRPPRSSGNRGARLNIPCIESVGPVSSLGTLPVEMPNGERRVHDEIRSLGEGRTGSQSTLERIERSGGIVGGNMVQAPSASQQETVAWRSTRMVPSELLNPAADQGAPRRRPVSNGQDL